MQRVVVSHQEVSQRWQLASHQVASHQVALLLMASALWSAELQLASPLSLA